VTTKLALVHARLAQDSGDRGSVLVYAILFPVSLLLIASVVQIGLIGHGNNLLSAAAELGVEDARSYAGGDGRAVADDFLETSQASGVVKNIRFSAGGSDRKRLTIQGTVLSIVPGVDGFPITRIARGPTERLTN
jgi:hypothetical protein